ncbi:MAG TPA: hypothetical protein VK034_03240, partial [Enhygromyxa sp.]|nr:hypothetical protein [Enhygromyxa sp.]
MAEALGERLRRPLRTWSVAAGIDRGGRERELGGLLARLREIDDDEIWLLFEAGRELRSSAQRRLLRELAQAPRGPALILVESERSSVPEVPELELERLELPSRELLVERVGRIADQLARERPALAEAMREASDGIAAAGLGLSLRRFDRVIAAAILVDAPTPASIAAALCRRRVADACTAALTEIEPAPAAELAGFDHYLDWLRERALSFDPAARRVGLRPSGAIGLVGVPGCGQRLAARVAASVLGLPLLRLGPTAHGGPDLVCSTLAALERAAPVAIWLDEDDPAPELADELARRLITQPVGVFVLATATRPEGLPSPWRSGHGLDQLFFVDLPGARQRTQLLEKLLVRAAEPGHPAPPLADPLARLLEVARDAEGCSGADLAHALTVARLRCFARGRPLSAAELRAAIDERTPIARRQAQQIEA